MPISIPLALYLHNNNKHEVLYQIRNHPSTSRATSPEVCTLTLGCSIAGFNLYESSYEEVWPFDTVSASAFATFSRSVVQN